jgi:integrase
MLADTAPLDTRLKTAVRRDFNVAIGQHVTPHTQRYTYIASMFAAGADQEHVAAQMGHEDITTTNRIYRCVLRRTARGEIGARRRKLLRALPPTPGGFVDAVIGIEGTMSDARDKGRTGRTTR